MTREDEIRLLTDMLGNGPNAITYAREILDKHDEESLVRPVEKLTLLSELFS